MKGYSRKFRVRSSYQSQWLAAVLWLSLVT